MTVKNDELVKAVSDWMQSQAGQDQFSNALKEVQTMATELEEARTLKPEALFEPVTL